MRVDRILGRGESAEGHLLLGAALFTAGNYPAAVKEFAKAEALNPDVPSLQSYYGQALLFTGDADGAMEAFRKELAANPNDFDANFQLASILAHRGKLDRGASATGTRSPGPPTIAEARDALGPWLPGRSGSARRFRGRSRVPAPPMPAWTSAASPSPWSWFLAAIPAPSCEARPPNSSGSRGVPRQRGFPPGLYPRSPCPGGAGHPMAKHHQ